MVTWKQTQFISFYDSSGQVILGKRKLGSDSWELKQSGLFGNVKDAHNSISMMVDGEGILHIAWDHHNSSLNYVQNVSPGSLRLTEKLSMVGKSEKSVSYPEFYKMPSGDLLFFYRDGESGKGNLVLNKFDMKKRKWTRLYDNLIDGENERSAYWQACVDKKGTIHIAWVWRETWDVSTNHDMCYMRSSDGGLSWEKSTGEPCRIPVNVKSAEYALRIPQNSELINQTSINADEQGNPYIVTYWKDINSDIPQYYLVFHNGKEWQTRQVSNRKTSFSLSGGGTKAIPISRPQIVIGDKRVIMVYRDKERKNRVSIAICDDLNGNKWDVYDLNDFSLANWEPTIDTELWKEKKILDIFVQKTRQGDGEQLEEERPNMIYVLEWK